MRSAVIVLLAVGAAASGTATEAVKERDAEIRAALPPEGSSVTPETRKKIEGIVTRAIDLKGMAESALGPRWKQMTESQRKRLVAAFEGRFKSLSGSELDSYRTTNIEYQPEVASDEGLVKVPTRVVVKGEPTEIAYTLRRDKTGWRIVDITVDGVSTVENYRSSFARVISKDGVEGLIRKLEKSGPGSTPAKKS